ncbi:MAG: hypothetical protein ABIR18_09535 [Chitinophagaceae bacterium]
MKYLHFPPNLAHQPIRLNSEELHQPLSVIKEFFSFYNLNQTRLELGQWIELALSADDPDMNDPAKRVNLLQFSYQLEAILEAVFVLHASVKPPEK